MANDSKAAKTAAKAKPLSKTAICKELATATELEPKQVGDVLDALETLLKAQLESDPHAFQLLDLVKFELVKKPAVKAGMKDNPFKPGEKMMVKAKPAEIKVKARVLKALKELEG